MDTLAFCGEPGSGFAEFDTPFGYTFHFVLSYISCFTPSIQIFEVLPVLLSTLGILQLLEVRCLSTIETRLKTIFFYHGAE